MVKLADKKRFVERKRVYKKINPMD